MTSARLRLALARDADWMCACAEAAYQPYVEAIGRRPAPMDADFPAHIKQQEAWIFERSSLGLAPQRLGYAILFVRGPALHIDNLALLPRLQGQGLGKQLVRACEAYGRSRACALVRLYTNAKMTANLSFYPALGFSEVDRRWQDGFDRVFFEKRLG